jgi:hypothetical protein
MKTLRLYDAARATGYVCENALDQSDRLVEDLAGEVNTRLPPCVRSVLATLTAPDFLRASVFNSRTSVAVQARRFFDFLAIVVLPCDFACDPVA